MGKTIRRFSKNQQAKEIKKKDKYKVKDIYTGRTSQDYEDDYEDIEDTED